MAITQSKSTRGRRTPSAEPLLELESLDVTYKSDSQTTRAVRDVTLTIPQGSALGLVGESGSGKTTVGNAILRALPRGTQVSGRITVDGLELGDLSSQEFQAHRWTTVSMVFQNAMEALNPVFTIGHQLVDVLVRRGEMERGQARARAKELMAKVDLEPRWLNHYPHELSGGMKQRVMIAMALLCEPRLVIADEPTTALDVIVREQMIELLGQVTAETGVTLLVISHDLDMITRLCNDVAVMYAGRIVEMGPTAAIRKAPAHPYTQALMAAYPSLDRPIGPLPALPGHPPDLSRPVTGCPFAPRCPQRADICATEPGPRVRGSQTFICHEPWKDENRDR